MEEVADNLLRDITKRNGHIYVCGDVKMAHGVIDAMRDAFVKRGLSASEAKDVLDKLKVRQKRVQK